jgi:serine/threonine-protein kinase
MLNQTINGYTFKEFIGSGGFGSVYKAEKDGQIFAIKVFREEYVLQEYRSNGDNRIHREIEIMKSVNHPFLIKYIDDFKGTNLNVPCYYLVMEFAEGKTLNKLIKNNELTDEQHIISIFKNILQGIRALHHVRGNDEEKGIIHRDLKPENIIVNDNGVKIIDYGISKIIDYTSLTSTGNFLGSPLYASPEQIADAKNIDKRSDLYTLGVILYEMITGHIPYEFNGLPQLINKIQNESPIPPRKFNPNITNQYENIIFKLLEKQPYQRYLNVDDVIVAIEAKVDKGVSKYDLSSKFVLRLYDDFDLLRQYLLDHSHEMTVDFPAIHQFRHKSLLHLIQGGIFETIVDPETIRFAYSTYKERSGLLKLPYCPPEFQVIDPSYLNTYQKQQDYVKKVIDEEAKLGADIFVSPYHYTHNSTVVPTHRYNPAEQWFDLDIKLLKESIDYKNSVAEYSKKKLYAGIAINGSSLVSDLYKSDLLNYYSSYECDGYVFYADGIDKDTDSIVLYHYVDTLLKLQQSTGRPVIAGRLNAFGLGLIALGLAGYSSGAARFESFSEELHKEAAQGYNMYERYYFPQLLGTISIERELPTRLNQIRQVLGACQCRYCKGRPVEQIVVAQRNKLHFLQNIYSEVEYIKQQEDKKAYFLNRLDQAIINYQNLPNVFREQDFKHLYVWKEVFNKIA